MATGRDSFSVANHYWDITLEFPEAPSPWNIFRFRRIGPASTKLRALRIVLSEEKFPHKVFMIRNSLHMNVTMLKVDSFE